jgi:hypothetical protein
MSTDTFDESPDINKKKNEQDGKNKEDEFTWENTKKFLVSVVYLIILVLIYFGLSGFVLFGCKVAQTNFMPTSANCTPYEDIDPVFGSDNIKSKCKENLNPTLDKDQEPYKVVCNIFDTIFESETKSEKIEFSYSEENKKNSVLDWLRGKKTNTENSFLFLVYSIIESLFVFDFNCLNIFLNWFNGLPEWLVVLFGPIIFLFWVAIVTGLSSIYYIILSIFMPFIMNAKQKAKSVNDIKPELLSQYQENLNKVGMTWDQLPVNYKWMDVGGFEWWIKLAFSIFLLLFIMVYFAISAPLSGLIMIWCYITIFSYVGYMKYPDETPNGSPNENPNGSPNEKYKKVGVFNIVGETYGQYKRLIVFIITILVILSAFANLGSVTGIISIITVISIYLGWIPIKVFEKFDYDVFGSVKVSEEQSNKTCCLSFENLKKNGIVPEYKVVGGSLFDSLLNIPVPVVSSTDTNDTGATTNDTTDKSTTADATTDNSGSGTNATANASTDSTTATGIISDQEFDTNSNKKPTTASAPEEEIDQLKNSLGITPNAAPDSALTPDPNAAPAPDPNAPDSASASASAPEQEEIDQLKNSLGITPNADPAVAPNPAAAPNASTPTSEKELTEEEQIEQLKKSLDIKGGRKIKNKSLSKYKNKYNVLNYK